MRDGREMVVDVVGEEKTFFTGRPGYPILIRRKGMQVLDKQMPHSTT